MSGLVDPFTWPDAGLHRMAENRNVAVVDGFEAVMKPKARLSKGMVCRMQASVMAMLKAGTKPDSHGIHKCHLERARERGGECQHKSGRWPWRKVVICRKGFQWYAPRDVLLEEIRHRIWARWARSAADGLPRIHDLEARRVPWYD